MIKEHKLLDRLTKTFNMAVIEWSIIDRYTIKVRLTNNRRLVYMYKTEHDWKLQTLENYKSEQRKK